MTLDKSTEAQRNMPPDEAGVGSKGGRSCKTEHYYNVGVKVREMTRRVTHFLNLCNLIDGGTNP